MKIELDEILWVFDYEGDEEVDDFERSCHQGIEIYRCANCDAGLTSSYCELMTKLDRAKLLPDDHKHYCCFCYFFEKIGILHLKKNFDTWDTKGDIEGDILYLYFFIEGQVHDRFKRFEIRVHDYERLLLE